MPRERQGSGRHDSPENYGAFYCSRQPASAVAEAVQFLRGHTLTSNDLRRMSGLVSALAVIELRGESRLLDLDDPATLAGLELRPSEVATGVRTTSQRVALRVYQSGASGFLWWSTLEASWINATLFDERVRDSVSLVGTPQVLTVEHPDVKAAAERLGITLGSP